MICSSAGTVDSPPSSPKRLVPVYLTSRKRSKVSASISFLRIAFLPCGVKLTSCRAFDAVLDPGRCSGSEICMYSTPIWPGIGALQDVEHLAERAEFEAERAADIDRPVVIGLGEAVGLGPELRMLAAGDELERVELGGEVAAGPVGADQHAGAQRVARRGKRLSLVQRAARLPERSAVPFGAQEGPRASASTSSLLSSRLAKKRAPFRIERGGVLFVSRVELGEIGGVGALQERRAEKYVVQFMSGHRSQPCRSLNRLPASGVGAGANKASFGTARLSLLI